jgi:transposase
VQAVAGGQPRATVAGVLGVHPKTVARWVRLARQPGGLDATPQPGPTPGLTAADLRRLEGLLAKGAKAHGWHNELWTAARVIRLIERHVGLRYHPEHVRKVLNGGWAGRARSPAGRPRSATTRSGEVGR